MTATTLADSRHRIDALLREDNERLRSVIKEAEWGNHRQGGEECPWCEFERPRNHSGVKSIHASDCPAFSPTGEVK